MALKKRLKLNPEKVEPEQLVKAFRGLGEEAKDFLEYEIIYSEDQGRRALAREILGYTMDAPESKIKRNVEE